VATDRLEVLGTDAKILFRGSTAAPGIAPWVLDGTWDGRWLEIQDPGGVIRRVQTREWWIDSGPPTTHRVSLVEPWPNTTDIGMQYRVYTPEYHLPADAVEIKSARLFADSNYRLRVMSQQEAEEGQLIDFRGRAVGRPEIIFKGQKFQLDAPTLPPAIQQDDKDLWIGPDPAGTFDYCFTYCWGRIDSFDLSALRGFLEPRWESAPSPISPEATCITGSAAPVVILPNIDFELGFGAGARATRSGIYKRLYARRKAVEPSPTQIIEAPGVFMLLAEVGGEVTAVPHNGSVLLDYLRRLKAVHGYNSVRFYPQVDARYEVDCRLQYRPNPLVNKQDAPRISEDGVDALVQKTLSFFYEYDGKPELAQMAEMRYKDMMATLTKRYGTIDYGMVSKRPARVIRRGAVSTMKRAIVTIPQN
jgi:hypothetical protein